MRRSRRQLGDLAHGSMVDRGCIRAVSDIVPPVRHEWGTLALSCARFGLVTALPIVSRGDRFPGGSATRFGFMLAEDL